jgi:hypothetical protein
MLTTIHTYLSVPGRLRFLIGWVAQFLLFLSGVTVLVLLAWSIFRLIEHPGGFLNPQPSEPFSPDFISYRPHWITAPRREREI